MTDARSVRELYSLAGRVAVVTGGAGLYGRPMSEALAEAGAHVVLASRDVAACQAVAGELTAAGWSAEGQRLDQGDEESIRALRDDLVARHGHIDVLVNGTVHRQGGDPTTTSAEDWDATSAVNSRGLFLMCRYFGEHMAERGTGSIVNIGSIYGVVGPTFDIYANTVMTNPVFYAYDKGGMLNLTRYLACFWGPRGVRVNCLSPGGLGTDDQAASFVAAYRAHTPLARSATVEDIKGPVVFLASDASAYVTGVNLVVDGGWTAH